jgi:hypothetical protein
LDRYDLIWRFCFKTHIVSCLVPLDGQYIASWPGYVFLRTMPSTWGATKVRSLSFHSDTRRVNSVLNSSYFGESSRVLDELLDLLTNKACQVSWLECFTDVICSAIVEFDTSIIRIASSIARS